MSELTVLYEQAASNPSVEGLGELSSLCLQMLVQEQEVERLEAKLAEEKRKLQDYRISKVPGLMVELNLSEVKLASGARIILQRVINCKLRPAVKLEAFQWLEVAGHGAMIKHELEVEFGRGEGEIAAKAAAILTEMGLRPSVTKDVHYQTLSAWARRFVEDGGAVPPDLFDLSILNIAKVK